MRLPPHATTRHATFEPPACPPWCEVHTGGNQWHYAPAVFAATKTCSRTIEADADVDGQPVAIVVRRFAAIEFGVVVVNEPTVTVHADGALSAAAVATLALTLARVAELVQEPAVA